MYKLIHKIIGFKTKNLYLAELGKFNSSYICGTGLDAMFLNSIQSFDPPKYTICIKRDKTYKDIFTKSNYIQDIDLCWDESALLVKESNPINFEKHRIKYKDAQRIQKRANSLCIKK